MPVVAIVRENRLRFAGLSRADEQPRLLEPEPRPLLRRRAIDGKLQRARRRLLASETLRGVRHHPERAQHDAGVARLAGDALRLVGGRLRHSAAQQPLRAVDALSLMDSGGTGVPPCSQRGEAVGGAVGLGGGRRQHHSWR